MSPHRTTRKLLDRENLGHARVLTGAAKSDAGLKRAMTDPREHEAESAEELTLDDLGGRSDALGG